METRVPLWLGRDNDRHNFFYENPDQQETGFMLRVPTGRVPSDLAYLPLRTEMDPSRAAEAFVRFLLGNIIRSPKGRVSAKKIWGSWAKLYGADPDDAEIAGIAFGDVGTHFRDCFGPIDRVRLRLDGTAQRVWPGYELADAGETAPQQQSAEVEEERIDMYIPFDGETRGPDRYRAREGPLSVQAYLDKDAVSAGRRPIGYRATFEPVYE